MAAVQPPVAARRDGVGAAVDAPAHAAAFDACGDSAAGTVHNPRTPWQSGDAPLRCVAWPRVSQPSSNQQQLATGAVLDRASRSGSGGRRRRCGWGHRCTCHRPPAPDASQDMLSEIGFGLGAGGHLGTACCHHCASATALSDSRPTEGTWASATPTVTSATAIAGVVGNTKSRGTRLSFMPVAARNGAVRPVSAP